jgi:hypothetical protein
VITAGRSRDEAKELLQDALREYLASFIEPNSPSEESGDSRYGEVVELGLLTCPPGLARETLRERKQSVHPFVKTNMRGSGCIRRKIYAPLLNSP